MTDPEKEKFKRQERRRADKMDEVDRYRKRFVHNPPTEPQGNEELIKELKKLKGGE